LLSNLIFQNSISVPYNYFIVTIWTICYICHIHISKIDIS